MSQNEHAKFLQGNLFRHIMVMSLTTSIGIMAIFLVDLVDMIFISMLGNAELAAAIGYSGAILFLTTSFGLGMSIAAGALVARALGAGEEEHAKRLATHTLLFGIAFGIVFAAIVYLSLKPLTALMGASGDTQAMAIGYLQIIIPSMPLLLAGMVGSAILRAHGDARRAMMAILWGGAINGILDPILIFGLDLELTGAALASVAARAAIAFVALRPLFTTYQAFSRPNLGQFQADVGAIVGLAFPAVLTQLATPIGSAYVTRTMAEFGEPAVAGMAMIGRLTPVAFAVIFALSGAIGPIVGQNAGAKQYDRVRTSMRDGIIFTAIYVAVVSVILFVIRVPLADLFGAQGTARELIFLFCGPLALVFFFNGLMFVGNAAFNNLGHPFFSTVVNWGKNTVGTIPFVIYGAKTYGAPGVLMGQAFGSIAFGLISIVLARWVVAREANRPETTSRPHFSHRARLHSLFHHRH